MSLEDIASTLRTLGIVGMGGLVAAGAVAIVTGPWIPLVLGAMALCAGLFALGALPAEAAPFALGLAAFGQAMCMASSYGALAKALDGERENLRNAAFLLVTAGINVAALSAAPLTEALVSGDGFTPVFVTAGAQAVFALVLAALLAGVVLLTHAKKPAEKAPPARPAQLAVVLGLVLVCATPYALSLSSGTWDRLAPELIHRLGMEDGEWLHMINPGVTFALALFAAVVFVILHALRVRVPALLLAGAGLATIGFATALTAALVGPEMRFSTLGTVLAVGAIGETLFLPLLLSRATADLPMRLETAAAALWLFAVRALMLLGGWVIDPESGSRALVWVSALAAVGVGLGLAAAAFPLRRVFTPATSAR